MHTFLKFGFHDFDPVVSSHAWLDFTYLRLSLVIAAGVEAFFHCALELVGNLGVTITMEDGPVLELHLGEHLALDLTVYLTSTLFNVETSGGSTSISTHQQISSVVLETTQLLRILVEL